MTELLALPFSPWSEKARWALDVRRVPYVYRVYQPIVGELALRAKLRRISGLVTVPVLTTDEGSVVADSTAIARWADAHGEGPSLFPAEHEDGMARFVELSERALDASRALNLTRILGDEEALAEMAPALFRRVRAVASRVGAFGIRRTLRKYQTSRIALQVHRQILMNALDELRAGLARNAGPPPRTLFGRLTYADIAAAQAVTCAGPPAFGLKLRPAVRRCWTDPELSERYSDLVTWRDALYEEHRPRPAM